MEEEAVKPEIMPALRQEEPTKSLSVMSAKGQDNLFHWFTEQELARFFHTIPPENKRDLVLFLTLLGTGKRISELLSIKRKDVDLENRTLKIVTLKKRRRKEEVIRLHQDVAYWLSIYTAPLKAEDLVFRLSRQYADELVKKYCQAADIPPEKAHCHTFRHTFAIRWLEQGKPIHKLKRHMGHSHIKTTMEYLKVVDSDYYETVDSLDMLGFLKNNPSSTTK